MPYRATLLLPLLAGCVAPVSDVERDKLFDSDQAPSPPDAIPEHYHLRFPREMAPTLDDEGTPLFSLCTAVDQVSAVPVVLDTDEAQTSCAQGTACWRSALEGEVSEPSSYMRRVLVSQGREASLLWGIDIVEAEEQVVNPALHMSDGVYTVEVRIPQLNGIHNRQYPEVDDEATVVVRSGGVEQSIDIELAPRARGARWVGVGTFRMPHGSRTSVELRSHRDVVAASAIRFRRVAEPHYGNVAWMAYLAANQYSHFWSLGPLLSELGFGQPGEGERWKACAEERRQLRWDEWHARRDGRELANEEINAIGSCVADWWNESSHAAEARARGDIKRYSVTALFEQYLVQVPVAGQGIQFFAGGELAAGELEMDGSSTQAFFAYHPTLNVAVIAFRGTQDGNDIRADARAWPVQARVSGNPDLDKHWGEVHRGFQNALEEISLPKPGEVLSMLDAKLGELSSTTQIFVTGHSLGGALATLMAANLGAKLEAHRDHDLANDQVSPYPFSLRGLYTFGCPRVGDREFASQLTHVLSGHGVEVLRVRHAADAVTRIPLNLGSSLCSHCFDYMHAGPMLYIHPDGTPEFQPVQTDGSIDRDAVDAHFMTHYYGHTRRAAQMQGSASCTVDDGITFP